MVLTQHSWPVWQSWAPCRILRPQEGEALRPPLLCSSPERSYSHIFFLYPGDFCPVICAECDRINMIKDHINLIKSIFDMVDHLMNFKKTNHHPYIHHHIFSTECSTTASKTTSWSRPPCELQEDRSSPRTWGCPWCSSSPPGDINIEKRKPYAINLENLEIEKEIN